MAINRPLGDFSREFNSVYNITLDLSGWDKSTIQVVAPLSGAIIVYGSNDGGGSLGVTEGNATLATNFYPVQVTNLATGAATGSISSAGDYKYEVNAQYLRLQGTPAGTPTNVYRLFLNNQKGS